MKRDLPTALRNVLIAAESFYAFIGGDEPQLGKDMFRVKQLIDSLEGLREEDSDVVCS